MRILSFVVHGNILDPPNAGFLDISKTSENPPNCSNFFLKPINSGGASGANMQKITRINLKFEKKKSKYIRQNLVAIEMLCYKIASRQF